MSTTPITVSLTTQPRQRPPEDQLGFGKYFSDHIFVANYDIQNGWGNFRVEPYHAFSLDPSAAVLHYGQAIFEGMKAFYGVDKKVRLFRPFMNWKRMKASAERLCMPFLSQSEFMAGLTRLLEVDSSWIPNRAGTSLYIRPTLIATEPFLGVRPAQQYLFFVITSPVGAYYGDKVAPVKIWVERQLSRAALGGIGATKAAGNYATSLAASVNAIQRGYAQVLWLDSAQKKYVEEVGTMNVFFVLQKDPNSSASLTLVTPPLGGTILPGVTRDSVIALAQKWGLNVEERPIELAEVIAAHKSGVLKEVFGTGTAASITPVGELGFDEGSLVIGDKGAVGPMAHKLYQHLIGLQYGSVVDDMGWTTVVETPALARPQANVIVNNLNL